MKTVSQKISFAVFTMSLLVQLPAKPFTMSLFYSNLQNIIIDIAVKVQGYLCNLLTISVSF